MIRPKRLTVRCMAIILSPIVMACGDNVSPEKGAAYQIVLQSAPPDVGALMLSIEGSTNKTVTFRGSRIIPSAPQESSGVVTGIVIGATVSSEVAVVSYQTAPPAAPTVQVRAASAGSAGQYRVIASSEIKLTINKVSR